MLVALLGGGYGRSLRALLLVQGPRAIIVLRGTFLVALLTALLVEPQREALTEFLQHALLLALRAMHSILTSASGHIGDIQDGRRLLQPGMADQRNRRFSQGMLGRHVASSRRIILFIAGPLSAANRILSRFYSFFNKISQMREIGGNSVFTARDIQSSISGIGFGIIELVFVRCLTAIRFNTHESRELKKNEFLIYNELKMRNI